MGDFQRDCQTTCWSVRRRRPLELHQATARGRSCTHLRPGGDSRPAGCTSRRPEREERKMTFTCRGRCGPAGFWCALLMVVMLWPVAADAQPWVATDIGVPAGVTASRANAVSDTGQVVGSYTDRRWTDPRLFLDAQRRVRRPWDARRNSLRGVGREQRGAGGRLFLYRGKRRHPCVPVVAGPPGCWTSGRSGEAAALPSTSTMRARSSAGLEVIPGNAAGHAFVWTAATGAIRPGNARRH